MKKAICDKNDINVFKVAIFMILLQSTSSTSTSLSQSTWYAVQVDSSSLLLNETEIIHTNSEMGCAVATSDDGFLYCYNAEEKKCIMIPSTENLCNVEGPTLDGWQCKMNRRELIIQVYVSYKQSWAPLLQKAAATANCRYS